MNLVDLPSEILVECIFSQFESLHTFKALSQTCTRFKYLLSESLLVIHNSSEDQQDERPFDLSNLDHVNISKISLELLLQFMQKYHFFIFNFDISQSKELQNQIRILKIVLKSLQDHQIHHTVSINSQNFNANPLMRFLLPKLNSTYTEFYFPHVKKIAGFDDLRALDNTNCYFSQLEEMTIGSLSFQLFNLTAPKLRKLDHSQVLITRAITESVSTEKITCTKFLDNLRCSRLDFLEVIGAVEHSILGRFDSLKTLRIYADNSSQSLDLTKFHNLKELVVSKCARMESVLGINGSQNRLEKLDLSNNKSFDQHIVGSFRNLRKVNLSNTKINRYPELTVNHHYQINLEGCKSLVVVK